MFNNLHCGACNKEFKEDSVLIDHIKNCPAAKAILLPVTAMMLDSKLDADHSVAHLIWNLPENRSYILEYARAIANDMGSFERSIIHRRMCAKLGLDYSSFRPFESEKITEIPSEEEAEKIIYKAIGDLMRKKIF